MPRRPFGELAWNDPLVNGDLHDTENRGSFGYRLHCKIIRKKKEENWGWVLLVTKPKKKKKRGGHTCRLKFCLSPNTKVYMDQSQTIRVNTSKI